MSIESKISRPIAALPPTATCVEAARLMLRENVGSVVIEREGAPIGIVTDRDLAMRIIADEKDPKQLTVGSIMSECPAFLATRRDLGEAIEIMRKVGVRRLPAVDGRGQLVGMLSMDDVLVALSDQLAQIGELLRTETRDPQAPE